MLLKVLSLLFLVGGAVGTSSRNAKLREFVDLADHVNSVQSLWKATTDYEATANVESLFTQATCDHSKNRPNKVVKYSRKELDDLPKEYDVREKWGDKCQSTKRIFDQSGCGSCWAFGSVEAMSDRICIKSDGKINPQLSAGHLTACVPMGCEGGNLLFAYGFYQSDGIVTGGEYNSGSSLALTVKTQVTSCSLFVCACCNELPKLSIPYPFPKCAHHTNSTHYPSCDKEHHETPECVSECQANYTTSFEKDKHYGEDAYTVESAEDMQADIYKNGPVTAGFMVYKDFLLYKDGVYKKTVEDSPLGGHAVKVFGWGEEEGVKYWLVANSWNEEWGDHGTFKILRGENECNIESMVIAGQPRLDS